MSNTEPTTTVANMAIGSTDAPLIAKAKSQGRFIRIDRRSKWGNPFHIGRDGDRETVIAKYRAWLLEQPHLLADLESLRGMTLGCWCSPLPCHGDVLIELLEQRHKA